jgi:nucleoside-diphosphate-sugar epimerase
MHAETLAILGANGVYGRHLIPRLVADGYRVRALVRRPEAAGVARACGAEIRVADIFDEDGLAGALAGCLVGINLATSLPGPSGRGDFASNDRLRREGTLIWIRACQRAQVQRVVQQSIAMVNAAGGDAWSDEDTAPATVSDETAARAIDAALAMEESVRCSGLDALILRGGLFYGPGTGFDEDWFARAQAGTLRLPGDGAAFVSLVHIADMADATRAAVRGGPRAGTLIVCDDHPARWREVFAFITELLGKDPAAPGGRMRLPSFRTRNQRAREALGWAPRYGDFRVGLAR